MPTTKPWLDAQPRELTDPAIASAAQIAHIPLVDSRNVAVLEVRVTGQVDLQRNRAGLRNLVARFIDNQKADAVLAFFVGDTGDYRFSFVARTSVFTADGQLELNQTAPRRYTYLFGPGQACRTAVERFEHLRATGTGATLKTLIAAFQVEPLFKEFYREYGRVFDTVEAQIRPSLPEKEPLRLFTQRLFNRLMFIAFVERKGWLRFGSRTSYLAALWDDYTAQRRTSTKPANFYRDRLVPLFFEGLNQSDRAPSTSDPRFGAVPYLNGGLFERAEDGTDALDNLRVPDEAAAAILDTESGLFSRYNFTVAESTPLEIDVAVDPEMLGKVFEELVTGRHEQGSYYTPKPIVSFMGRAALVEYLSDTCPGEQRSAIEKFVHDHDASALADPEAIHRAVVSVKICDPACGSGAYLLGLLHELLDLRTCIFASLKKQTPETSYKRRLEIIEKNLYGVDLDPFAVNIARLRLWLSLAVEFEGEVPPPLPNLDFKIERGDALAAPAPQDIFQRPAVEEFRDKKAAYLRAHGEEKTQLKVELEKIRADLAIWQQADLASQGFNWAVEFAEVFLPEENDRMLLSEFLVKEDAPKTIKTGGFDIVVANPPYVRMELIKPQKPMLRKRFPYVHAERADLYIYFYARAHELLRPGGVAAFISSNKWLRAGYGESLRKHLLDAQAFRLVMDFGDLPVFESASAYPCIFVWSKKPRADSPTLWASIKALGQCYAEGVRAHFQRCAISVPASQFSEGGSRLTGSAAAGQQQVMEMAGPRLRQIPGLSIIYGLKTGLNQAFVISGQKRAELIEEDESSADLIKPLLFGSNIRRYCIAPSDEFIIYTTHSVDIKKYPAIARHLTGFRKLPTKAGQKPRGLDYRATDQEWFELQQPQAAYVQRFLGAKVVYPDITKEARFVFDDSGYFLETTCFAVANADHYMLAVLNSAPAWWYLTNCVAQIRGGFLRFKAQYLESMPIPDAPPAERELVGDLAKRTQTLHGKRRARCEQFLRDLGLKPADSTARNPLEQPWSLTPNDYAVRARKATGRAPDLRLYEAARDETVAFTEQIAKIEAVIDGRVAALYGLDAEDQRWAAKTAPGDDKQALFFNLLGRLKARRAHFSHVEVQAAINDAELSIKDETLNVYLSEATKKGLIHDAGRGWYSRLTEPLSLDPHPVQKLIRATKKALPLLDFCVWSTAQLNPWMHHLLAHPVAFLYVSREALESVGENLRAQGWDVAVNPGKKEAAHDIRPGEKMVVLRPSHSKQPVPVGHQAAPEQVLVEMLVETGALALMDASEAKEVLTRASDSGWVKMSEVKRFADFRQLDWEELWPII
ncbi:MAG: DUF6577 family protein [Opitutaceae bacterium]